MKNSTPTLKTSEADFVVLSYPGGEYLVNREEILSSHFGGTGESASGEEQPVGAMEFNRKTIPLVSLDTHLKRHFGENPDESSGTILFIRGSGGKPPFPKIRRKSDGGTVDTSVIGIRTSARASMTSILISDLKPLPHNVRKSLARLGFLAVRFSGNPERPQYLLDIRTAAILSVIGFHNKQVKDEHTDS